MASVTSLDQDMRKLRLDRYTPSAANEVKSWIETTLNEKLPAGDLMEALRDGVALCKLANLATSPGVRYKSSSMPFVQMENISHFLKACEGAPLSLPSHDRFLTVDLYDQKDPAQVIQCIAAFSRRANLIKPDAFPTTIGAKSKGSTMSPQGTGGSHKKSSSYTINTPPSKPEPAIAFNPLNRSAYSGRSSPTKQGSLSRGGLASPDSVSSWSNKFDEQKTAPAWNIHQYGYMGGASQGNQGIAFGARRQIVSTAPEVPTLAEKEQRLKQMDEEQKLRKEEEMQRQVQLANQEEAQAQAEEERRWDMETRKLRELELQDEEKIGLQEKKKEAAREEQTRTERASEAKLAAQRSQQRQVSDSRLNGQFLSQYQAGQSGGTTQNQSTATTDIVPLVQNAESQRIAELERQLEEMREAERIRQQNQQLPQDQKPQLEQFVSNQSPATATTSDLTTSHEDDWDASERDYLKKQHKIYKDNKTEESAAPQTGSHTTLTSSRPLPNLNQTSSVYATNTNRTDRFLSSNPAPQQPVPSTYQADAFNTTTEQDIETSRRLASQQKTKAGGWASKSLLEREMELERERQREWEEEQKATASRAKDPNASSNPGGSWDVHQYGYMGGDSQNRGGPGLGVGGPRRQIIGPRPPP